MTGTHDTDVEHALSLDDLHLSGATLVITYICWWRCGKQWMREQEHAIVGHRPEMRFVLCTGPDDLTDTHSDRSLDSQCDLCGSGQSHTVAAHSERWRQDIPF